MSAHFCVRLLPPIPLQNKLLSPIIWLVRSFVCVQRCAAHLLRDGDTWVLKNAKVLSCRTTTQPTQWGYQPIYRASTVNEPFTILFSVSVKNCIMHKLLSVVGCRWVGWWVGWFLLMFTTPTPKTSAGKRLFIKKSSLIVWKEIMLILHFTRWQLRHIEWVK